MLLYGASGHAKVIRDCLLSEGAVVKGIFDDNPDIVQLDDTKVLGFYKADLESSEELIIAISDNLIRKKLVDKVKHAFGKTIHKSAIVSSYASIGKGSVVFPQVVVNSGCEIGNHTILNTGSIIEYDSILGDYIHISPNVTICAGVIIGEGTHIGAGATIIPGKQIGKWCVIGAGSVITQDIPDYSMVVGVPGKIIRAMVKKN
jgi:sugar O-acyltransferase (sialic acid O-acetyltransferase NeuD family)